MFRSSTSAAAASVVLPFDNTWNSLGAAHSPPGAPLPPRLQLELLAWTGAAAARCGGDPFPRFALYIIMKCGTCLSRNFRAPSLFDFLPAETLLLRLLQACSALQVDLQSTTL
eukprot:364968-Chlamydomonas_euryale.AAC.22